MNVVGHRPFSDYGMGYYWYWRITEFGWPFPYAVQLDASAAYPNYLVSDGYRTTPLAPQGLNRYTWMLIADIAIGLLIVVATTVVVIAWAKASKRKFQFQIRHLLAATTAVAVLLAICTDYRDISTWVVAFPTAFGVLCLPTSVGLLCYRIVRRSDLASRQKRRAARNGGLDVVP